MSSFLEELGGLTEGVGAEALAFAAGFAAARALEPAAVSLSQDAFNAAPTRRLDAETAAEAAAENYAHYDVMADEASYSGYDASRFAYIYDVVLTAPGVGELLTMLRRKTINTGNFEHGLQKARLEPMWTTPLEDLQNVYLSPAEVALGIVRSTIADPGLLVTTLDTSGSTIPKYPVYPGSALTEAAAGGIDEDRLRVMVGAVGLPMSPQQAASATFRNIINRQAFNLAILEGDIRPEYADAIFDQARQILTANEYAELQLRGFLSASDRQKNTSKWGMSAADSDLLYNLLGRAPAAHAITTGLARGGKYDGTAQTAPQPYLSAMQRGNIRPEYYSIEYANRYSYPSGFQIRAETQDGNLSQADSQQILLEIGWSPKWAEFFSKAWAGSGGAPSADKHVAKAQTQVWTATHKAYVNGQIAEATATAALEAAGVPAGSVGGVLDAWNVEHDLTRKSLSAAQIKKAWFEQIPDPATGQPISEDEAVAMLGELGYAADAARLLLAE